MSRRKKSDQPKRPAAISVIAIAIMILFLIRLYQVWQPLFRLGVFQNGFTGPLLIGWKFTSLGKHLLSSLTYFVLSVAGIVVLIGFLRLRREHGVQQRKQAKEIELRAVVFLAA